MALLPFKNACDLKGFDCAIPFSAIPKNTLKKILGLKFCLCLS